MRSIVNVRGAASRDEVPARLRGVEPRVVRAPPHPMGGRALVLPVTRVQQQAAELLRRPPRGADQRHPGVQRHRRPRVVPRGDPRLSGLPARPPRRNRRGRRLCPRPEHRAHRDPRPRRRVARAFRGSPPPGLARHPRPRRRGLRLCLDAPRGGSARASRGERRVCASRRGPRCCSSPLRCAGRGSPAAIPCSPPATRRPGSRPSSSPRRGSPPRLPATCWPPAAGPSS